MSDNLRFFAIASDSAFDEVRFRIYESLGLPRSREESRYPAAANLPHNPQGKPLMAFAFKILAIPTASAAVDGIVGDGLAVEITSEQYEAATQ